MERATFVVMASRKESSEGMPIVVTEALSCRTPLLGSDHPCLTDILRDGEGLRYFPSGDPEGLARLILEIVDDPGRLRPTLRCDRRGLEEGRRPGPDPRADRAMAGRLEARRGRDAAGALTRPVAPWRGSGKTNFLGLASPLAVPLG